MRHVCSDTGFTLVELVTVIAVMAILSAVASSKFVDTDVFDTRGCVGLLSSSLRYAQKTAIAQHKMVYVAVDTTARTIRLCYDVACGTSVTDPVTMSAYQQTYSAKVSITPGQTVLGFGASGAPSPNANTNYVVKNTKNATQTTTIQVEADTGYVRQM